MQPALARLRRSREAALVEARPALLLVCLVGVAAAALVFATLFFGGGSSDDRLFWLGGAALVVAGLVGAAALTGLLRLPRLDRAGLALLVALTLLACWAGASLSWSIVPDRSWQEFDRAIVYLAFAVLGVLLGALAPRAPRVAAGAFAVLLGAVLGWALLGKVFPGLYVPPAGSGVARLRNPIGYWNALALLGDAALPLALWIAAPRRRPHAVRAAGVLLFYLAFVAVLLTYSRTGVVVGALVVAAWLLLALDRLESLAATAIASAPGLGVAVFAFTREGLRHFEPHSARVHDGAWFGFVLVAGALLVAATAVTASRAEAGRPLGGERRRALERRAALALVAAAAVAVAGLAFRAGGPSAWWSEFTHPVEVGVGPNRLESVGSTRWTWWTEAWRLFEKKPLLGEGAGAFEVARRPIRHNPLTVTEPHSTPLQFLSELGIVGFLLAGAAALATAFAAVAAMRRAGAVDRVPALALALGLGAYGVHALVDYDWEFVAVTGPALLVAGLLAASGRPVLAPRRRLAPAGVAVVVVLAALYSLGAPWLASRRVDQSYAALDRNEVATAAAKARSAHRLNPFSPEPWWALAAAAQLAGDDPDALRDYEKAAVLQPQNSDTWYSLGQYEFDTGRFAKACYALDLAYRLDPRGPAGTPGGLLDQVKRKLPGCPSRR